MRFKALAVCLAACALAACGGDATGPQNVDFTGTYALQSINGSRLPYVLVQSGNNSITVTNDQLTVASGGTWSENGTYQSVSNGVSTTQTGGDYGTWIRSGTSISLYSTSSNSTSYAGSFAKNRLDFADGSTTYVFTK